MKLPNEYTTTSTTSSNSKLSTALRRVGLNESRKNGVDSIIKKPAEGESDGCLSGSRTSSPSLSGSSHSVDPVYTRFSISCPSYEVSQHFLPNLRCTTDARF